MNKVIQPSWRFLSKLFLSASMLNIFVFGWNDNRVLICLLASIATGILSLQERIRP